MACSNLTSNLIQDTMIFTSKTIIGRGDINSQLTAMHLLHPGSPFDDECGAK